MTTQAKMTPHGSVAETNGVRICANPEYMPDHSDQDGQRYIFRYKIRVENDSPVRVQLLRRRWLIVDSQGVTREVKGEGVIGQQPTIEPGHAFAYTSWAPIETPWGTMEGVYTFVDEQGETFDATVARFYLVVGESADG